MKKLKIALIIVGTGTFTSAHADFNCKLYAAPNHSVEISSDGTLNDWLKANHATDPSGSLRYIGNFVDNSGNLEFKYLAPSSDDANSTGPANEQLGPVPKEASGKCDQPSSFLVHDVIQKFSCYDWSPHFWRSTSAFPQDLPYKTDLYVLGPNPNSPNGNRVTLLLGGSDCDKVAKDGAWTPQTSLAVFYSKIMVRTDLGPAAVLKDGAPGANSTLDKFKATDNNPAAQQIYNGSQSNGAEPH